MKNITFLIGNGFDLNAGLNTTYPEFYKYYVAKHPNDMLARDIAGNFEYWSDLELGLGRYTSCIKPEYEKNFWDSERRLEEELVVYLESQMRRVRIGNTLAKHQIALEMQRSLTTFYREFSEGLCQQISKILSRIREPVSYRFITFNYTDVLERCIQATKEIIPNNLGRHKCFDGMFYHHFIADILYIHGTTKSEMVLGVNDENQISNTEFIKKELYRQLLIKEETSDHFDRSKIGKARTIIDNSVIICLYGLSIGQTDKMWWQYICKWLQAGQSRVLIIYTKPQGKGNAEKLGKHQQFPMENEMLRRFRDNTDVSDTVWRQIRDRIYVMCNPGIFRFKLLDC